MAARAGEYHIHSRFCIGVVAVSGDQRLCRKFGRKFLTLNGDRLTRDALGDARVRERRMRGAAGAEPAEVDVVALLRAADAA